MSRTSANLVRQLIESTPTGGYTLPAELLAAHAVYQRVEALTLPDLPQTDVETAARALVDTLGEEGDADLTTAAMPSCKGPRRHSVASTRSALLTLRSTWRRKTSGGSLPGSRSDSSTSTCARPSTTFTCTPAPAANALAGYQLSDTARMVTAPAKARTAYAQLPGLVERRKVIFGARRWVNTVADTAPQHDTQHLFGEFRDPLALSPWWRYPAPVPLLPAPEDPAARLLWVVTDAAPAKPWLPTVDEQDARCSEVFGEHVERLRQGHRDGLSIGARGAFAV